ncbi:MAG TPA: hypothetical protein DCZ41_01855 [Firmicutes bacterium]|nr:hypothetical protein [Bacillota bacterium]
MEFLNAVWEAIVRWVYGFFGIQIIMDALAKNEPIPVQGYLQAIFGGIVALLGILSVHRFLYFILGVFGRSPKYPEAPKDKRYAFIIAAWNEEKVIGNLIKDIRAMDYPQDLIEIFVVADNCTDKTGEIAASLGAHVYYHDCKSEHSKGYGLRSLVSQMSKDIDIAKDFYAYSILDADNVPAPDYLSKINNYLQATNVDECVGYRNSKNLSENWISAMCGVQNYGHCVNGLRPRAILDVSQEMYGPSTTLRSYILADGGWKWVSLTEDLEMAIDLTARGYKTGYTEEAVFYEEQPNKLKLLWRQRTRWSRGVLIAFKNYGGRLLKSFFKKPSWSKYDIFWQTFPISFVFFWMGFLYQIISIILFLFIGNSGYFDWWTFGNYVITLFAGSYVSGFLMNLVVIIREWKHFLLPFWKTLLYIFLFPLYNVVDPIFSALSAFINPEWKHIDHHFVKNAKDLAAEEAAKNNADEKCD